MIEGRAREDKAHTALEQLRRLRIRSPVDEPQIGLHRHRDLDLDTAQSANVQCRDQRGIGQEIGRQDPHPPLGLGQCTQDHAAYGLEVLVGTAGNAAGDALACRLQDRVPSNPV